MEHPFPPQAADSTATKPTTTHNPKYNNAILISANMTPHKNRFNWCSIKDFYWLVANVFR